MIYFLHFLCLYSEAVEIKEQLGVVPEASETRSFFESLGSSAASLVSRGQLLRRHDHWQPCSDLSLADCCQREALRVNDGQGRCRCQAAKQAELCTLEWQSCELQKEHCCQSLPAMMLVAYGNSSASGYNAQCACAPVAFSKLNQLQLEQRCSESTGNEACNLPSFIDLDDLRHTDFTRDGDGCHKNSSAHFSVRMEKGMPYLLRFQVRHSEHKQPVDIMIGHHRTSLPATNAWLERAFRAPASGHVQMRIKAPCASLGEVQFATCKETGKSGRFVDMAVVSHTKRIGKRALPDAPGEVADKEVAAQPVPAEKDSKDVEIEELKDRVKEDEDKIIELEYKEKHAEMEKKEAEAAVAEPSGGTVPTWMAVATVALVLITGPLLKMRASQKAAAAKTAMPKAAAAPKAVPKAAPKASAAVAVAKPKAATKAGAKAKSVAKPAKVQVPEVTFKQLKAILKLQAVARGWKARLDVHPSCPKETKRTLNEGMQIAVSIQNISIKNVPEVNLMGGVDPFLEVQCGFSKDPDSKGRTEAASKEKTDRTEVVNADTTPKFIKTLDLPRVLNKPDQFLNFLLFDSGTAEDTFIGSKSLSVNKLLEGIKVFDLLEPPKPIEQELIFVSEYSTKKEIKAKFNVVICEAVKFVFHIKSAEKLPEVDSFGGIDSFIEVRATRSDVKSDWFPEEDPKCIWSGRTQVHTDSIAPKYDQEIKATLPADPTLKIHFILWDSNAPMADFPVAQYVMEMKEEICLKQDLPPVEHVVKFQKIPGQASVSGYQKASLKFSVQTSLAEPGVPPPEPPPPPPKPAPKPAAAASKSSAAPKSAPKAKGQAKPVSKATAKPKGAPGAKGAVPAA